MQTVNYSLFSWISLSKFEGQFIYEIAIWRIPSPFSRKGIWLLPNGVWYLNIPSGFIMLTHDSKSFKKYEQWILYSIYYCMDLIFKIWWHGRTQPFSWKSEHLQIYNIYVHKTYFASEKSWILFHSKINKKRCLTHHHSHSHPFYLDKSRTQFLNTALMSDIMTDLHIILWEYYLIPQIISILLKIKS